MLRIFTANRGTSRVRLTRFDQRLNEDESSSVHRGTVASTVRVKPGLLEKQQRQQRGQQQSHVNTSKNKVKFSEKKSASQRTKLGPLLETLIFKNVYFDTMIDVTAKKRKQRIGILYFQYCEREEYKTLKLYWNENSLEDWSHCLYRRFSCNLMTISGLFHQE